MGQVGMRFARVHDCLAPGAAPGATGHQRLEVIPPDPAHEVWELAIDQVTTAPPEFEQRRYERELPAVEGRHRGIVRQRSEVHPATIGEHAVQRSDIVPHGAVPDGTRATAVVPRHSANRGLGRSRNVDRKPQVMRLERCVEMIEDEARRHRRSSRLYIKSEHAIHVP